MRDVLRTFQERKEEIELYFQHINSLMSDGAKILNKDGTSYSISTDLAQILRANAFVLMYNLAEYSISEAIESIYLDIKSKGLNFNDIKDNIKKEIFTHLKSNITIDDYFISTIDNIAAGILEHYPKSRKLFSGNMDAKKVKDISIKYGFSSTTDKTKTKDGFNLLTIKERRNHLAHGFISFKECGQEYSILQLNEIKNEVLLFLEEILNNIDVFIKNQEYKR